MEKILCMILFSVIGISSLPILFADDYFTYLGVWENDPTVCTMIPQELTNQTHNILKSIKQWKTDMRDYDKEQLNYVIKTGEFGCDIDVIFNQHSPDGKIGVTTCFRTLDYILTSCDVKLYYKKSQINLFTTITHEMGHALGLGHRHSDSVSGYMRVIIDNDIMNKQEGPFQYITEKDRYYMNLLYSETRSGNDFNMSAKYYIPHE